MSETEKLTVFFKPTLACAKCKGACCKTMPAPYSPIDIARFFPAKNFKISLLLAKQTNKIAVDWWEGGDKDDLCFMRPAIKANSRGFFDPTWGGECVHLTEKGCELDFERRPYFCKTTEPKDNGHCGENTNTKYEAALLWQQIGINLRHFFKRKFHE